MSMSFSEAARLSKELRERIGYREPEYDPRFIEASHAVASGKATVDEAWAWMRDPDQPPPPWEYDYTPYWRSAQ